jgi:hypothetical protein
MNEIDRILTAQSALIMALLRVLVANGVITKLDLMSDLHRQPYAAPLPPEVLSELQALVARLPDR